jgi:DNA ligase (NAD+)
MTKAEVKNRIEKLKETIDHHRYLYHVLDRQEISQEALDSLKKELFDLEQDFPEFISADSPTQRVGGKPLAKFEKVRHPKPMISLNDAFSEKDIENWQKRNVNLLSEEDISKIDYYCEPKLDGLGIELIYKDGIFKIGATRGDGLFGEDVTQNLKTIEAIPLSLKNINLKGINQKEIAVRGEVIITKENFNKVNSDQEKNNFSPFANPRNLAAGSIRQLDPKVSAKRGMDSNAYDLLSDLGQKTHQEEHQILHDLGFKTNNKYNKLCRDLKEVIKVHDYWENNREKLPYEIDGIVVRINNNDIFKKLGIVGKAPRGAIAFKFPLKQAVTIIEDIKIQIGRSGVMTPVAILKPVDVSGVTISRATLHNIEEIKRLGLKIRDTVIVGRAGDVIPDIIKVLPEMRSGKEKEFKMPKNCPSCGKILVKSNSEILLMCLNKECPAQHREYFYHFVSTFGIDGLGPKIIDKLVDEGIVSDPAELFLLKEEDVCFLERFAEKSSKNLILAIQSQKKIDLPRFICSLGIKNIGQETARDLAQRYGLLKKIEEASFEELQVIEGIGPIVAKSISSFFEDKRNREFIEKLKKSGVKILTHGVPQDVTGGEKLKGFSFVLTGSLETMTREKTKEIIRNFGGKIVAAVSKKTDFVLAGKEPGSKIEIAKNLSVKIISEQDFLKMIK